MGGKVFFFCRATNHITSQKAHGITEGMMVPSLRAVPTRPAHPRRSQASPRQQLRDSPSDEENICIVAQQDHHEQNFGKQVSSASAAAVFKTQHVERVHHLFGGLRSEAWEREKAAERKRASQLHINALATSPRAGRHVLGV